MNAEQKNECLEIKVASVRRIAAHRESVLKEEVESLTKERDELGRQLKDVQERELEEREW